MTAPPDGPWIERWLSSGRLGRYLSAVASDRRQALALYEWNAQIGAALQRDLGHLEVALRNAYDQAATARRSGPGHWLRDDYALVFAPLWRTKTGRSAGRRRVDVNAKPRRLVEQALQTVGPRAPTGKVVAELPFGFWRYLSTSAHEKALWVPLLHTAFPPGTRRADVDAAIGRLHELRNRVAHHERCSIRICAAGSTTCFMSPGYCTPSSDIICKTPARFPGCWPLGRSRPRCVGYGREGRPP